MNKKVYIVMQVERSRAVSIGSLQKELALKWADSMIGVMPVFTNKRKAIKYAGGTENVLEAETEKRT